MSKKKKDLTPQKNKLVEETTYKKPESTEVQFADSIKENNLYYYIGLGLILLLIYIIRKNFLDISFERDEGFYMYSGKRILEGAVPFKDIGSQRLDGVFYIYAILVGIFGYTVKAMHLAFLFLNMCTATMLFVLVRKLTNNLTGIAASLFFALLSMTAPASGFTIQSEHLVSVTIVGGFLSLVYFFDSKKIPLLILSGLFFSLAFQIKQTSAFYGMLAGAILVFKEFEENKKNYARIILIALVFSISVMLPVAVDLMFVYYRGGWKDFNLWFFDIRKQYTSLISFDEGLKQLDGSFNRIYVNYKFYWVTSFLGTMIVFFTSLPLWKKLLLAGLNIAGFLTIVPGYHYYGHYFLQWIPAVAITSAIFIYIIQEILQAKLRLKTAALWIPFALIILSSFSNMQNLSEYYFAPNHYQILREVYGGNPFPESREIADKLNTLMKKEDKLSVLGSEVQMYVYTNKTSPSRFAYSGVLLEFPIEQSKDWQKEFIRDIENSAPKYVVFFYNPNSWMINRKSKNLLFPWFDNFSTKYYDLIGFADMEPDGTRYVWKPDPAMMSNPPKAEYKIFIFERKPQL
jgi:hypothetical protein